MRKSWWWPSGKLHKTEISQKRTTPVSWCHNSGDSTSRASSPFEHTATISSPRCSLWRNNPHRCTSATRWQLPLCLIWRPRKHFELNLWLCSRWCVLSGRFASKFLQKVQRSQNFFAPSLGNCRMACRSRLVCFLRLADVQLLSYRWLLQSSATSASSSSSAQPSWLWIILVRRTNLAVGASRTNP